MTRISADNPEISVEDFEELASKAPEGVKLEFIAGKLRIKPVPDQLHRAMVMWLLTQCMQHRPDLLLYPEQDLRLEGYRRGRAIADGALAPLDHFVAHDGMWPSPEGVLMTVEVTSHDGDTHSRDHVEKRDGYASAGIPVYLLIDRDTKSLLVHSDPRNGTYHLARTYSYGETVQLPSPVGITLETEKLKDYSQA
ncbi:Uma2 family endonuclease [Streptomyces sp. NPDC003023]|uniref:Uma2 family endonuclease n=1 Tax=Streptomyces sp. NPDC003023 TaxID=3364675 RepID=UPI003686AE9A